MKKNKQEEQDQLITKVVAFPSVARKLLKLGYKIVDLKQKKENIQASLFIFQVEGNFNKDLNKLMKDHEEKNRLRKLEEAATANISEGV